ncbi:MAG: DoxX family protein [uncultured bacterium]|nr:MAG: DoxX family protein [uncultured bacterium]
MNTNCCRQRIDCFYKGYIGGLNSLQSLFLLLIRLYWGVQFFQAGKGKLSDIEPVIEFFTSLNIPLPAFSAYLVGGTELIGGLFLILGFASRLSVLPLVVAMTVAYLTADLEAVKNIFLDPDLFVKATPFPFLITSLIVLLFGAGFFSLDTLMGAYLKSKNHKISEGIS